MLKNKIGTGLTSVSSPVAARVERVETTLLTGFYKWASPTDRRIHSQSIAITALDEQASSALNDITEDRLQKVELGQ